MNQPAPDSPGALNTIAASLTPILGHLTRLSLVAALVWLGLTKCVPAWNPAQADAEHLVSLLTAMKIDPAIGLIIIGVLQALAGLCLMMRRTAAAGVLLFALLLGLGITLAVMHLTQLVGPSGWVPNQQGLSLLKGLVLHLVGLTFAAQAAARR
jgi:hypothetical protein